MLVPGGPESRHLTYINERGHLDPNAVSLWRSAAIRYTLRISVCEELFRPFHDATLKD